MCANACFSILLLLRYSVGRLCRAYNDLMPLVNIALFVRQPSIESRRWKIMHGFQSEPHKKNQPQSPQPKLEPYQVDFLPEMA